MEGWIHSGRLAIYEGMKSSDMSLERFTLDMSVLYVIYNKIVLH